MRDQITRLVRVPGGPFIQRYRVKCELCPTYRTLPMEQTAAADEQRRHRGMHSTVVGVVADGDETGGAA